MAENIDYSAEEVLNGKINKILDDHSVELAFILGGIEGGLIGSAGLYRNWDIMAGLSIGLLVSNALDIGISAYKLGILRKEQETASKTPGSGKYIK